MKDYIVSKNVTHGIHILGKKSKHVTFKRQYKQYKFLVKYRLPLWMNVTRYNTSNPVLKVMVIMVGIRVLYNSLE